MRLTTKYHGGQVVSLLAFYSDDPSSNHVELYNFAVILSSKRTKISKKRPDLSHFLKGQKTLQAFFELEILSFIGLRIYYDFMFS